jgi:hypothetical protein
MPRGRPRKNQDVLFRSAELIGWALGGLEREILQTRERLTSLTTQANKLRSQLGRPAQGGGAGSAAAGAGVASAAEPAGPRTRRRRRRMSAEARKRISEMMKKRWAERRKKNA